MRISRERGSTLRHIRRDHDDASALCGLTPKPINPDMTARDCWITMKVTDNPAMHANCDRCLAALQKKGKRK